MNIVLALGFCVIAGVVVLVACMEFIRAVVDVWDGRPRANRMDRKSGGYW